MGLGINLSRFISDVANLHDLVFRRESHPFGQREYLASYRTAIRDLSPHIPIAKRGLPCRKAPLLVESVGKKRWACSIQEHSLSQFLVAPPR